MKTRGWPDGDDVVAKRARATWPSREMIAPKVLRKLEKTLGAPRTVEPLTQWRHQQEQEIMERLGIARHALPAPQVPWTAAQVQTISTKLHTCVIYAVEKPKEKRGGDDGMTLHHLLPVAERPYWKGSASRRHKTVWVCRRCHVVVHKLFRNMTLAVTDWDFVTECVHAWRWERGEIRSSPLECQPKNTRTSVPHPAVKTCATRLAGPTTAAPASPAS